MANMEKIKEVIKEYYDDANYGLYDCRNLVGDPMETIYDDNEVQIDICYRWSYFEVFGLTDKEFQELTEYYDRLEN